MSEIKKDIVAEEIVEIRAQRYSTDWVYETVHKVDLNKILGIELHLRGDSWHIVVVEKYKLSEETYAPYYSRDLDHWVFPGEVKKLLNNPKVVILKIVNGWGRKDFNKELKKIIQ